MTGISSDMPVLSRNSIGGFCFGEVDEDGVKKDARIPLGGGVGCGGIVADSFCGSLMMMRASRRVGGLCSIIVIMIAQGPGWCVMSFFVT